MSTKTLSRLVAIVALVFPLLVLADDGELAGTCPDDFRLHVAGSCTCDHQSGSHLHAGTNVDRNGDGWICMKHVSSEESVHVHIDNSKQGVTPASPSSSPFVTASIRLMRMLLALMG